MRTANDDGHLNLPSGDVDLGWGHLIWLLVGTITDIVEEFSPSTAEATMAEAIMRFLGVNAEHAEAVSNDALRPYPKLPVDLTFSKTEAMPTDKAID